MNQKNFDTIEKQFGILLPDDYKRLHLFYPDALATLRILDVSPATHELYSKSSKIRQVNNFVRSKDFVMFDRNAEVEPWKNHMFVIGEDGHTGYYVINLKNKNTAVYSRDVMKTRLEKHAASLRQHISKIFDSYCKWTLENIGM